MAPSSSFHSCVLSTRQLAGPALGAGMRSKPEFHLQEAQSVVGRNNKTDNFSTLKYVLKVVVAGAVTIYCKVGQALQDNI